MTGKERVLMAIEHREPDRVPVDVWYTPEMRDKLASALGILESPGELDPDPLCLKFHDLLKVTVGPAASYYLSDKEFYTDEWGIGWRRVDYGHGHYTEPVSHPLGGLRDPESFSIPDFNDPARYEKVRHVVKYYGGEYAVVGEMACTLFELSWYLRGFERILMDLHREKDFMRVFLGRLKGWALAAGRNLIEAGVDILLLGDDFGMQDRMIVSPEMFRELFKPLYAELFEKFKDLNPNVKLAFHSDGNIEPIIPDFIEIGLDILNPVQPRSMDPKKLKKLYGKHLAFWGTMDNQGTIPFGSPEEVVDEVLARIRDVAPGGGLILGPAHNVQPITPVENMLAFYKAVERYGTYTIGV
jgi:uroporphyrinogen decarboxylase